MGKKDTKLNGVKEIARRAKVSLGTVDRVIHNRSGVSPKTREKIIQIIKEIDYKPNLLARRLAFNKATYFATLIPKVSDETSFWEAPLRGIEQAEAEIKQYNVKVKKFFFDQNDKESFVKEARNILKEKFDGILLAPSFIQESVSFTNLCQKRNIPYVFIDSDIPGQPCLSYIGHDLYHSGYLAANFANYLIGSKSRMLIVNISTEIENHHHLLRKEEGFRGFFEEYKIPNSIEKIDIKNVDYNTVRKKLDETLVKYNDVKIIFVTNAKVSIVANYLKESGRDILLIGYDYVKENVDYLKDDIINFLICQQPGVQAYKGIMALYKHTVIKLPVEEQVLMPIDIIMKSNYAFYSN